MLEFSFKYSGFSCLVAQFWISEWLTLMIAFTYLWYIKKLHREIWFLVDHYSYLAS